MVERSAPVIGQVNDSTLNPPNKRKKMSLECTWEGALIVVGIALVGGLIGLSVLAWTVNIFDK